MFNNKKDDLSRKILTYVFFFDIVITLIIGVMFLVFDEYQEFSYFQKIIGFILIISASILIVFFIFCVAEIILNNVINAKIMKFISKNELQNGIDYIEKLPKIKVCYDMYERQFYYRDLLNLYLDNIAKAKENFHAININSSIVDTGVFVNTILYLLLIYEESNEVDDKNYINKCFCDNIIKVKKNRYQYQKYEKNIVAIENILKDDWLNVLSILREKRNIPIINRLLTK